MAPAREPVRVVARQLINVLHHQRSRYDERWFGKGEAVLVTEKLTLSDGRKVKNAVIMENPTVRYNLTAPEWRAEHRMPETFYPIDRCVPAESQVRSLFKDIAEATDQMDFFNETRGPGSNRRRQKLHGHRWLHGSDADVTDHYIDRYMEHYAAELDVVSPLECAFGDIEVDPIDHNGFPNEFEAPCPITMLTYFHAPSKKLTIFLTRSMSRPNPQIAEFEANQLEMREMLYCEANRAPLERAGLVEPGCDWRRVRGLLLLPDGKMPDEGPEQQAEKLERCRDVEFVFCDTEMEAVLGFLQQVNEIDKPDTFAFWNGCFDLNTMINRLRKAGHDPAEAFTAGAFAKWPYAEYKVDIFNTEPTDSGDAFTAAGYTVWMDQMLSYASLRKQQGKKESYGLDFTLRQELKESKVEFEGSIRDLAYRDYAKFVVYGALDVVPMATLEEKLGDIDLSYRISMLTRTRMHKVMKKTVCLRNLANVFLRERGFAISNNRNRLMERTESEKFRGGFVASPSLMDYAGILLDGVRSARVFEAVVDLDAKALYPSVILLGNIDAAGQLGRLLLYLLDGREVDSSEWVEAVAGGSPVETGRLWFGLPGLAELSHAVLGAEGLAPAELAAAEAPLEDRQPSEEEAGESEEVEEAAD
jgi:hypothetical protein